MIENAFDLKKKWSADPDFDRFPNERLEIPIDKRLEAIRPVSIEELAKDVPDVKALAKTVAEINKGDSKSVLDAYKKMTPEDQKKVELYTDKNSDLKMRMTTDFQREALKEFRTSAFVDGFLKHDIDALNALLPMNQGKDFFVSDLVDVMKKHGWSVEESLAPQVANGFSHQWKFIPPGDVICPQDMCHVKQRV